MTIQAILLGTLIITSYRATPAQTKPDCLNNDHCYTATGDHVSEQGAAVSPDLLRSGKVHYGDIILVSGLGYRIVNDTMASRNRNAVDLFVYTASEEHKIGVKHLKVWRLRQ